MWNVLDRADPARRFDRIYLVVDNGKIHQVAAVRRGLQQHPRFQLLFLPTYCPRAYPIERCFGDLHDKVTRNHQWKRRRDLVADVDRHLRQNGPWHYQRSEIYQEAEVTQALNKLLSPHQEWRECPIPLWPDLAHDSRLLTRHICSRQSVVGTACMSSVNRSRL